jgi:hypothetical protein
MGDGQLSEKINLHCGHLSDNINGHLSDNIMSELTGQKSEIKRT